MVVSEDLAYFQEESPWSIRRGKKSNIINHNWWHLPAAQQINKNLPSDPDDKSQFGLSWDVVVACLASHPAHADFTPVHLPVFFVVSFSSLEDELPGDFAGLWTWEEMHAQFWLYKFILTSLWIRQGKQVKSEPLTFLSAAAFFWRTALMTANRCRLFKRLSGTEGTFFFLMRKQKVAHLLFSLYPH